MNKYLLFLIAVLSFSISDSHAQKSAWQYHIIADSLNKGKQYGAAEPFLEKAIAAYSEAGKWDSVGISMQKQILNFYAQRKCEEAQRRVLELLPMIEDKEQMSPLILANVYSFQGFCNGKIEELDDALAAYHKAIAIYKRHDINHRDVAYVYKNAAQIFMRRQDYQSTTEYLKKALAGDSTKKFEATIYSQLANSYYYLEDYETALSFYQLGDKAKQSAKSRAVLNASASSIYFKLEDFEKAEKAALASLDFYEGKSRYWQETVKRYKGLAEIAQNKKDRQLAEKYFREGEKVYADFAQSKSREGARLYCAIGDYYSSMGEDRLEQALDYYQKALIEVVPEFSSLDIETNPSLSKIYAEPFISTAAVDKAETLQKRYHRDGNIADLELALGCYQLAFAVIDEQSKTYSTEAAKLYLGTFGHDYYEGALHITHLLYEKTKDARYLDQAFSFMEHNRAAILTAAIQRNRAIILSGIPDTLLTKEKELRSAIADQSVSIMSEQLLETEKDSAYISELESGLADLRTIYNQLIRSLESNYPRFRNFTTKQAPPTIQQIQNQVLTSGDALLEYFVSDDAIYLLKLQTNQSEFYRILRSPQWDEQLTALLDYFKTPAAFSQNLSRYQQLAHQFFQILCPGITTVDEGLSRLIILPDGPLAYLPFEALLTQKSSESILPIDHFLLHRFRVSYAWSASLLQQPLPSTSGGHQLSVAPLFANGERGMAPLLHSSGETASLSGLRQLHAADATAARFRQLAPQSQLIHLSTHAHAAQDDAASIAFIDTALYLPEIYAMDLQADLVVLSACETGLGKIEKGEGVMSLARSFRYAGANSLVASLWSVNEQSTATLFAAFYEQLLGGTTKGEALRAAKLAYLEGVESDPKKSPYYWAGWVYVGKDGAIELGGSGWASWVWLGMIGLIGIGGFLFFRNRNKKSF